MCGWLREYSFGHVWISIAFNKAQLQVVGRTTCKYADGAIPAGSRRSINADLGGRINTHLWPPLDGYLGIAKQYELDPCQMSLAWAATRPFMTSQIIGATTKAQLQTALESTSITLSDAVMRDIQNMYRRYPMPY